jgi:hypothetical protein
MAGRKKEEEVSLEWGQFTLGFTSPKCDFDNSLSVN